MTNARSARERNPLLMLLGIVSNQCPKCMAGPVWRTLWAMHKDCAHCGYVFEREIGYFSSAMVISYGMGAVAVLPLFLVLAAKGLPVWQVVGIPAVILAMFAPLTVRISRLMLLHTDPRPFDDT